MANYSPNDVINGLYGYVYDENGEQLDSTQEFEANLEFDKADVPIPGKLMKAQKVIGASGSGKINFLKIDSKLQRKIAENPTEKYNYIGKLADPTARGQEAVLFKGVSFDSTPLSGFTMNELVEVELDYTFDDFEYLDSI